MAADALGQLEAWFVCGSQHMYGAEQRMGTPATVTYLPDARSRRGYDALYAEYMRLHDPFGRGGDDVMKTLKRIRDETKDVAATTPRGRR